MAGPVKKDKAMFSHDFLSACSHARQSKSKVGMFVLCNNLVGAEAYKQICHSTHAGAMSSSGHQGPYRETGSYQSVISGKGTGWEVEGVSWGGFICSMGAQDHLHSIHSPEIKNSFRMADGCCAQYSEGTMAKRHIKVHEVCADSNSV